MLAERPRELCEELVTAALGPVPEGDPAPAWQMGKTKVFLRQGKLEDLDKAVQVGSASEERVAVLLLPLARCHPPSLAVAHTLRPRHRRG